METYICPDCGAEHGEPLEASLGHRALCLTCAIVREGEQRGALIEIVEEVVVYRPAA